MALAPAVLERVTPIGAGWFAGDDIHGSYYGPPLRLARTARRLDTSPAWFPWVGTVKALEVIRDLGVDAIGAHDVGLANRFLAGLGLGPTDSAIVRCEIEGAQERLERGNVVAAVRAGHVRASWHAYNTEADVDRVLELLTM